MGPRHPSRFTYYSTTAPTHCTRRKPGSACSCDGEEVCKRWMRQPGENLGLQVSLSIQFCLGALNHTVMKRGPASLGGGRNIRGSHRLGPRCCLGAEHWSSTFVHCYGFSGNLFSHNPPCIFRSHAMALRIRQSSSGPKILLPRPGRRLRWIHRPWRVHLAISSLMLYGACRGALRATS